MSYLITVTDFSDIAQNGVKYACEMAKDLNVQLVLMPFSSKGDSGQLDTLLMNLRHQYPSVNVNSKHLSGNPFDQISSYARENGEPELIIAGNGYITDHISWFDHMLSDAMTSLQYPLLAIPAGYNYKPVNKLCFAYDNSHLKNEKLYNNLISLTKFLNTELHVVNIQRDGHSQDNSPDIDTRIKDKLYIVSAHFHMVFKQDDVDMAIHNFSTKNKMDIIALYPHNHPFFLKFLHKSHTLNVAHHSHLPVLSIH